MPPRITQKSHRPRASHRMMVGTSANGWLAQLRNDGVENRCMKPLKGDQQLRSVSRSYSVALQALEPKSSPRRRGLDASTDRGLTERNGEVFFLDILSHRMSAMAMLQQQSWQARANSIACIDLPSRHAYHCTTH